MIKNKKSGFTLSEVLITLAITGTLAILVLPGLIKDTTNKAMSALLQSTVAAISDAVQNELSFTSTKRIEDTAIMGNPAAFLRRTLDVKEICTSSTPNDCFANTNSGYRSILGQTIVISATKNAALLSNGVAIDILIPSMDAYPKHLPVGIDINGPQQPNILGVDRQLVCISLETDINEGTHVGDVGACLPNSTSKAETDEKLKSLCKNGNVGTCYYLLERSGFNHKYLEE